MARRNGAKISFSGLFQTALAGGLFAAVVFAAGCPGGGCPLTLHVLLPLSGDLANWGALYRTASELARDEINADPALAGVELEFHDTQTDAREALDALMTLHDEDSRLNLVIGPASSEEAANLRLYANRNDIVLLSPASTSTQLALADDTLLRLEANDIARAGALVAAMKNEGVAYFLIVCRGDSYGTGLADEIRARTLEFHGARLTYPPGTTDFTGYLETGLAYVHSQQGVIEPSQIGVVVAGFDEVGLLMEQAANYDELSGLRWYCSEVWTGNEIFDEDQAVADFLIRTRLTATQISVDRTINADWRAAFSSKFEAIAGMPPSAEHMLFFDSIWASARACDGLSTRAPGTEVMARLLETLDSFCGITGCLAVDEAGDRRQAEYEYVRIKPRGDEYVWFEAGSFTRDGDGVETVAWNEE